MILGIYGSGGQGRDVFDLAKAVNKESKKWDDFVFINDFSDGKQVRGKEVITFNDFSSFVILVLSLKNTAKILLFYEFSIKMRTKND